MLFKRVKQQTASLYATSQSVRSCMTWTTGTISSLTGRAVLLIACSDDSLPVRLRSGFGAVCVCMCIQYNMDTKKGHHYRCTWKTAKLPFILAPRGKVPKPRVWHCTNTIIFQSRGTSLMSLSVGRLRGLVLVFGTMVGFFLFACVWRRKSERKMLFSSFWWLPRGTENLYFLLRRNAHRGHAMKGNGCEGNGHLAGSQSDAQWYPNMLGRRHTGKEIINNRCVYFSDRFYKRHERREQLTPVLLCRMWPLFVTGAGRW